MASKHGSARWARAREIREHWLDQPGSIYLGAWTDWLGRPHALTRPGGEHVLLLGPSRSGKGVGCVIPTCLEWPGALLCHDEKTEIYEVTAPYRASLGQVARFAPAEEGTAA
jgi:type IV secretion system protein VirD4